MREYSDMSDVRRILEDDKDRLLQESIITDLIPTKYEKHSQTDHINPELKETDKIQHYITKIASLKSEMLERTQQYNKTEQ
jgi:isochorismate synthase EntC